MNDEGFLFDPHTGESFLVNEVGRHIFNELKQGVNEVNIASHLAATYNVDGPQAQADVVDFVQQLRNLHLV